MFAPEKPTKSVKATGWDKWQSGQRDSRKRGKVPGGRPADMRRELTGGTRHEILRLARYAKANSGLKAELRKMMAIYAVGGGRWPQSEAPDKAWRELAEARFYQMSKRPEITGRYNWREVQTLVSRALDDDGEIFALKVRDSFGAPKIQLLETHALSNRTDPKQRIWDGVEYDALNRPVAYLKEREEGGEPIRIPAQSMIHVFDPDVISMSRALPGGQHGLLHIQDELEMLSLEKQAVKRLQNEAMVLKSNRENALDDGDMGLDSELAEIQAGTLTTDETEVAEAFGARVQRINESEELSAFEFQRPYSTFGEFLALIERDALGGQLPYEVARDPSKVGGASVRLVVSKADRIFQDRGSILDDRFNAAVWFYFIGTAIDRGELAAVPGWNDVTWTSPKRITVDAGREARENRADVFGGLKLLSESIEESGGDFDTHMMRRAEEARKMMDIAGHPADKPIPLWMIYKPDGVSLTGQTDQETEV